MDTHGSRDFPWLLGNETEHRFSFWRWGRGGRNLHSGRCQLGRLGPELKLTVLKEPNGANNRHTHPIRPRNRPRQMSNSINQGSPGNHWQNDDVCWSLDAGSLEEEKEEEAAAAAVAAKPEGDCGRSGLAEAGDLSLWPSAQRGFVRAAGAEASSRGK